MEELRSRKANSSPLTPLGFLERAATVYGDYTSVIYNSTTYTWSQTHRRCLQLASSLSSLGIKRGQVVSVIAPNIPAMYELHFAVPMSGAVLNSINTRLDARTISVLLRHSESKLWDQDQLSEWDPMILNYTSGTTSSPKGVVHCHRGIFFVTVTSIVDWGVPKQPVYLWTLPMFHANGWCFPWGMAALGATNICLRKFDGPIIFDLIKKHGVTHMCGAPVVLNMLTNSPNNEKLQNPSVLYTHPAINEAAVVARPDEFWGETPCAFVSFRERLTSKPSEKEIMEFCRAKLPHYMVPKTVVFKDELPKTSTGKIQKFVLRDIAKAMGSSRDIITLKK
ncbi:putative acyl-activating enzyme 9 [Quercus suber]|uniref:Acyl-activating enzyme 9 n=1 Tax=Quercus suber TaxID=58331 RepID=A0AAW0IW92_QUESU